MRSFKNQLYIVWIVVLCIMVMPTVIFSATSDEFTVTQSINTFDPVPPTIPGNFTVTPITTSQIDLDWDASSDNIGVSGYQVFRDAVQIATTTLTAFSDTGLTPSTTYAYNVTAFDVALNFSTSTAVLSTTTLPVVVIPPAPIASSTGTSGYYIESMEIQNLVVAGGEEFITLQFDSTQFARSTIRWGQSKSYELGFTGTDTFQKKHQTLIDNLSPGTTYQIEIVLFDRFGIEAVRFATEVTTDSRPDDQPPTNVTNLQAVIDGAEVVLTWQNPAIPDFAKVRVLSSDRFYPLHRADGWLVYEGDAAMARDNRPLTLGMTRYYTVFVYDKSGNISSGAIVAAQLLSDGTATTRVITGTPVASSTIQDSLLKNLRFSDVMFSQDGEAITLSNNEIVLAGNQETHIAIPYQKLPEHLKTIVVTFTDPDDPEAVFSFLLRIDQTASEYTALIGSLEKAGRYPVSVSIFDFKTQQLIEVAGSVVVQAEAATETVPLRAVASSVSDGLRLATIGLLTLLFILLLWRRRQAAEDKHL